MGIVQSLVFPKGRPRDPGPYGEVVKADEGRRDNQKEAFTIAPNILALRLRGNPKSKRLAVYAHGNMQCASETWRQMQAGGACHGFFEALDASEMWFWEYAGYGARSGEKPTERQLREDAEAVGKHALREAQGSEKAEVVFVGWSLGSYAATVSARAFQIALGETPPLNEITSKVVLISPLASAVHARFTEPFVAPLEIFNGFRTIAEFQHLTCPCMLVHGQLDEVVLPYNSELLANSATVHKDYASPIRISDGRHAGLMSHSKPVLAELRAFITPPPPS